MKLGWIIAAGILVLPACGAIDDAVLTHDLLDADFTEDDGTFATGENRDYRSEVVDGKYRVVDIAPGHGPFMESFGFFARTAYNVIIEARIAALDAPDSAIGLECVHAAGGGRVGERYVFTVSTSFGDRRFVLGFIESYESGVEELAFADGAPVGAGQRISLHCDNRAITGLVDGEPVVSFGEPVVDSFKAAALVFSPWAEGDWVEFDDVTAVVPEHGGR
jgi:hypothetical protein